MKNLEKEMELNLRNFFQLEKCNTAIEYTESGNELYLQSKYKKAIKKFEEAIKLDAYNLKGKDRLALKQFPLAIEQFRIAIENHPNNATNTNNINLLQ